MFIDSVLVFFLCQSRVGPVQWLQPYTDKVLVELGQKGVKSLLAVPVRYVFTLGFILSSSFCAWSFGFIVGIFGLPFSNLAALMNLIIFNSSL